MKAGLLALLCCILWGSAAPFIKLGYRLFQIQSLDQILTFAGIRFFMAGILVSAAGSLMQKRALIPEKRDWIPICVLAFFQTFGQYWLYYQGVEQSSGVQAAILTGTGAFLSLLAAVYVFRYEKMTSRKLAGCLLAFAGIVAMNGTGQMDPHGAVCLLLSQLCAAASAGLIKRFGKDHDPILLSGWQFVLGGGALMLSGHAPVQGGRAAWAVLAWLALVSAAAYTIWSLLLKKHAMSRITIFESAIPVTGVLFSAVLLQEWEQALSPGTVLALVLVAAGILLVHKKDRQTT